MNATINWVYEYWLTGWMGLFLYWLPLSLCVVGYTIRTFDNFKTDVSEREKYLRYLSIKQEKIDSGKDLDKRITCYYRPTDTIGTLIGRALVSITPVANLWAGVFDVAPRMFSRVIKIVEKAFDTPLVPEPKL